MDELLGQLLDQKLIEVTPGEARGKLETSRVGKFPMSGIVGIVHFDGAPVERHLLGRMTGFMAFRGPDAQEIWIDGNAGFGHALLKTTDESEHERQPFTLDGRIWIVADARVDARRESDPKTQSQRQRK